MPDSVDMDLFHWLGFFGMMLIVLAYWRLQIGKYTIHSLKYQSLNLLGSIALIVSLLVHFNLGSFLIEVFWIAITCYGIAKNIRKRINSKEKYI